MKRLYFIVSLLLIWHVSIAAELDAIVTKSREQIQCYVISYNDSIVVVNAPDVNDNDEYTIPLSDIDKIYLHTGELILPGKEPATWRTKPKEQYISDKPEVSEKTAPQETQQVAPQPQPKPKSQSSEDANYAEANEKFKLFMFVLKGGIESSAPEIEKTNTLDPGHTYISIYITGFQENQQDVGEIIGNDVLARFCTIDGYKALLDSIPDETPIDSIANIAQRRGSKLAFAITVKPFRDEFYLQSMLIDADKGDILVTSRSASSFSSLDNILKVSEELTLQAERYLKTQRELKEVQEELSKMDKEAEKARITQENEARKREAAEKKRREEEESQRLTQESLDNLQNALYESTQKLTQTITEYKAVENTYALDVTNSNIYPVRVVFSGKQIGTVQARTKQRFLVSTDCYGQLQIIQASGYKSSPKIKTYQIQKQDKRATVTINS